MKKLIKFVVSFLSNLKNDCPVYGITCGYMIVTFDNPSNADKFYSVFTDKYPTLSIIRLCQYDLSIDIRSLQD